MIKCVLFDLYRQWSPSQVGELLKTKAILVTGVPVQAPGSFEDAIKGLNRFLDASVICNGRRSSGNTPSYAELACRSIHRFGADRLRTSEKGYLGGADRHLQVAQLQVSQLP